MPDLPVDPVSIGIDLATGEDMTAFAVVADGEVIAHATSEEAALRIAAALNTCPLQSFERARAIGERLCKRWNLMTGSEPPLPMDDLAWADMVQFIVRMACEEGDLPRLISDEVAPDGGRASYNDDNHPLAEPAIAAQQGS